MSLYHESKPTKSLLLIFHAGCLVEKLQTPVLKS